MINKDSIIEVNRLDLRAPAIEGYVGRNPVQKKSSGNSVPEKDPAELKNHLPVDLSNPNDLFEIIAEFSFDWVYWLNPDNTISFISPSTKFITGYSREEFLQDPNLLSKIVHPEDSLRFQKHKDRAGLGDNVCAYEYRIIKKSGEIRWLSHFCQAVYDNDDNYLGRYVSNRDVTVVRNLISRDVQGERRVLGLCESLSLGLFRITADGKLIKANEVFLRMFGLSSLHEGDETYFSGTGILNAINKKNIIDVIERDGIAKNLELACFKKDRTIIYLQSSVTYVRDREGNISYFEGVVQDITMQKKSELLIIEAKDMLRRYEKLKSEFLATISHEIRTPLNAIINFSRLLKSEPGSIQEKDLKENIEIIENEGKRIQRTIDMILEMSQLITDTYEANPAETDIIKDVLNVVREEYIECAEKKKIELSLDNRIGNSTIMIDKHSVTQIFRHLIGNAIKYTGEGSVKIISYRNAEERVTVEVKDCGIGIDEKYVPYLFTLFSQEDNSYSRMFEGTGLGLAIVKKYCELNDAEIEVESRKGFGSTFRVTFMNSRYQII